MTRRKFVFFLFLLILFIFVIFGNFLPFFPKNLSDLREIFSYIKEEAQQNDLDNINPKENNPKIPQIIQENNTNTDKDDKIEDHKETTGDKNKTLPEKINHYLPFTSQAPLGKWDNLHEEACEEASLLMAHYFINNDKLVLSSQAESDLKKLVAYTKEVFPKKEDVNVEELLKVASQYYKYENLIVLNNPTIEIIQSKLSSGSIIIAPMAGRLLNNPFFKNPGPLYHMLIISGYDKSKKVFITQDPGTKRGKDFTYSFDVIMNSIHDFPGNKENINEGKKNILVIPKG